MAVIAALGGATMVHGGDGDDSSTTEVLGPPPPPPPSSVGEPCDVTDSGGVEGVRVRRDIQGLQASCVNSAPPLPVGTMPRGGSEHLVAAAAPAPWRCESSNFPPTDVRLLSSSTGDAGVDDEPSRTAAAERNKFVAYTRQELSCHILAHVMRRRPGGSGSGAPFASHDRHSPNPLPLESPLKVPSDHTGATVHTRGGGHGSDLGGDREEKGRAAAAVGVPNKGWYAVLRLVAPPPGTSVVRTVYFVERAPLADVAAQLLVPAHRLAWDTSYLAFDRLCCWRNAPVASLGWRCDLANVGAEGKAFLDPTMHRRRGGTFWDAMLTAHCRHGGAAVLSPPPPILSAAVVGVPTADRSEVDIPTNTSTNATLLRGAVLPRCPDVTVRPGWRSALHDACCHRTGYSWWKTVGIAPWYFLYERLVTVPPHVVADSAALCPSPSRPPAQREGGGGLPPVPFAAAATEEGGALFFASMMSIAYRSLPPSVAARTHREKEEDHSEREAPPSPLSSPGGVGGGRDPRDRDEEGGTTRLPLRESGDTVVTTPWQEMLLIELRSRPPPPQQVLLSDGCDAGAAKSAAVLRHACETLAVELGAFLPFATADAPSPVVRSPGLSPSPASGMATSTAEGRPAEKGCGDDGRLLGTLAILTVCHEVVPSLPHVPHWIEKRVVAEMARSTSRRLGRAARGEAPS